MLFASHNGGLGIPVNEMQRSINGGFGYNQAPGGGQIVPYDHWQPFDPGMITRGYAGFGDVPNDFEASVDLQYIPVRQGWYYGNPVDGGSYPKMQAIPARGGFGDAASEAAVKSLAKSERLQTILQVVSTMSIATVATLAVIRAIRGVRNGKAHFLGDDDDDDARW